MLGNLLRKFARWSVGTYYRPISFEGVDQIPAEGPVLLYANHPNSLFDPVIVAMVAQRPVQFLAKAPLFKIPVLGPMMFSLGMIPAYRGRDDASQVRQNYAALESASEVLVQGNALGIFPEGQSHDRLAVDPIRSGLARIALDALDQEIDDLTIVPVGLNFADKVRFRSALQVAVGRPLKLSDWVKDHDEHRKKQIRALTEEVNTRLQEVVIHLDNPQWEPWLDAVDKLTPNLPQTESSDAPRMQTELQRRKWFADQINRYVSEHPAEANELAQEIESFNQDSKATGLRIDSPLLRQSSVFRWLLLLVCRILLAILLAPWAIASTIHHVIPFTLARLLASRFQAKTARTDTSFYRLLFSLPLYFINYAVIAWLIASNISIEWSIAWTVFMLLGGPLTLDYWRSLRSLFEDLRESTKALGYRSMLSELRTRHGQLAGLLQNLAEAANRGD